MYTRYVAILLKCRTDGSSMCCEGMLGLFVDLAGVEGLRGSRALVSGDLDASTPRWVSLHFQINVRMDKCEYVLVYYLFSG